MIAINLLSSNFPFSEFRHGQQEIIETLMLGKNALAMMPTGGGKSLTYQFFAKVGNQVSGFPNGMVLVISPLIALMQDQVKKAQEFGIRSAFINSSLSTEDREKRYRQLSEGQFQLLFVTPERFRKPEFLKAISTQKISLFAVDEAHCISQWGHDFRPDYGCLAEFREMVGNPLTLALTATATSSVQKDILSKLAIPSAEVLHQGIERSNLALHVHDLYGFESKVRSVVGLWFQSISENKGRSGIIYFTLISTLRKFSQELQRLNISHLQYHGDLSPQERRRQQKMFIEGEEVLILATPAFGLGIDKSNVGLVIHAETPGSLEAYFQEVGRAGRDGVLSGCHLLYDAEDVSIQMEFIKWSHPEDSFILRVYELIANERNRLNQNGFDFLREQMVFKSRHDFRVEAAVAILERWGCLQKCEDRFPFEAIEAPTVEQFLLENGELLKKGSNSRLLDMVRWAEQSQSCRLTEIYKYFGFDEFQKCGICDVCKGLLS